jgi:hypothetical protein
MLLAIPDTSDEHINNVNYNFQFSSFIAAFQYSEDF